MERHDVMYNDFILVGPGEDPLKLREFPNNILEGLKAIAEKEAIFVSRETILAPQKSFPYGKKQA